MPEPRGSPAGNIMMMEAQFSLESQGVTKLPWGGSWTYYDAPDGRPGYKTAFTLKAPSKDFKKDYDAKLKSGLDIVLKLTTPNDPKEKVRHEIDGKIKVKLK